MRVLVVPNEGGGADAIRSALSARGHGVVVAKSPWSRPSKRRELTLAADVARCAVTKNIDVAYVEGSHRTSAVTAALAAARVPYVLDVQDRVLDAVSATGPAVSTTALARPRLPITVELAKQAVRLSLRGASKATTSSRAVADHLVEQTGVDVAAVVEEPIVLDRLPLGARRDARAALGLLEGPRFAALVANLDDDLPYELLLHAHRAVAGVGLLVAGDGPGASAVAGMSVATRPSSPVMHIGPKTDATRVASVCAADIALSIRRDHTDDENKRYAALGRRQVLLDVPGARDLAALYPTHDTVFVAPPTVDGLADALRRALEAEKSAGPLPFWAVDAARRSLTRRRTESIVEQLESCA